MKELDKYLKQNSTLIWITYFVLIVLSMAAVVLRGTEGLEPIYYMNIGIDVFGMIVIVVIFICCSLDPNSDNPVMRYYKALINVTFLGLFSDLYCWLVNGLPAFRTVNIIANTLYYLCLPLGCYLFWRYVENMLRAEEALIKKIDNLLKAGMYAAVLLRLVNIFAGMYFTVGADGFYSRSWLYPLSMVYMFAVSAITMILIIHGRKKMERRQIVILVLYVIAPTVVGVITMMKFGLSVSYGVITVIMLLMYCIVNIEMSLKTMSAKKELNLAAEIQQSILPNVFPPFPAKKEIDLHASMDFARAVGGDFYDYFLIDDDHLCMVIADVSGKGIPAALFMMNSKTVLHSIAMVSSSPAEILSKANEALCRNNQAEMFVTVWLGILELSTGKLTAANAGHEYPIIKKFGTDAEVYKDAHGFVLGGMETVRFREYEMTLEPGTKLFVYTDGLTEAVDSENRMFGMKRTLDVLNRMEDSSPEKVINAMRSAVEEYTKGTEPFDDLTMLCLEYLGR